MAKRYEFMHAPMNKAIAWTSPNTFRTRAEFLHQSGAGRGYQNRTGKRISSVLRRKMVAQHHGLLHWFTAAVPFELRRRFSHSRSLASALTRAARNPPGSYPGRDPLTAKLREQSSAPQEHTALYK